MKRNDIQDSLQEGFEPAPLPPIGPDGAVTIPPLRRMPVAAPSLCQAGPCIHYHRFVTQLEAARPIANELGEHGQLVGDAPEMPVHVQTHHYCYPTTGVETELGSLPVVECNKWAPVDPRVSSSRKASEEKFFATEQGQAFLRELAAFRGEQAETETVAVAASEAPTTEGDITP